MLARHPWCQRCAEARRLTPATEVHHIVPCETAAPGEMEGLMFDPDNLMPLCHDCHVAVHVSMGKGMAKEKRKRDGRKLEEFVKKYGL